MLSQHSRRRRPARRGLRVAFWGTLATLALSLVSVGSAVVSIQGVGPKKLPDYDSRTARVAPSAGQLAAARALRANVRWTTQGTPSSVVRYGRYLTMGLRASSAAGAARSWLASNKKLFRLASVSGLRLIGAGRLRGTQRAYSVSFRQSFGGLSSADGVVSVALVGSSRVGWKVTFASSSLTPGAPNVRGTARLSAIGAWLRAARAAGLRLSRNDVAVEPAGADRSFTVRARGLNGRQTLRSVAFGTPRRGALRAYEATVSRNVKGIESSYLVVIDARTGSLLYRQDLVDNVADNPTWNAFTLSPPSDPINRYPWNYPSTDTRELWCWTDLAGCDFIAQDTGVIYPRGNASKVPWDVNAQTNTPWFQTTGNNADAIERWVNQGARIYGVGHHATSASRDYQYPWTNVWFTTQCNPANLAGSGNDIDAAMANLFAMHNRMHDFSYYLGFDEDHWNAQQFNYGSGTLDQDAVNGNAQSAAISGGFPNYSGRDNANMGSGADGQHPQTNMFLWQPLPGAFYAPCVDGDYDMAVIGHEYGHAIENRLIAKGVGARQGNAAGAMGEAFGDFDALEYLNAFHYGPVPGADPWSEGAYVTGNHYNAIRDFLASEPMGGELPEPGRNPKTDPLNFGSFGFDNVGPEVHADGEIWVAVNYDLRDLLLKRYPAQGAALDIACARGQVAAGSCPGNRRWIQLYYDAMILMPRNPTMIDARNAVLAADVTRFGGANQDVIWRAFALRGFGRDAVQATSNNTDPIPDFASPLEDNATLVFKAVSKDGSALPVNANVYVGDYQARATPIADTNPATTGPNLDDTAQFVPTLHLDKRYENYNFVANAPGYGHVRFMVKNLKAGETRLVTIEFPTNYASTSQGGTASGDGTLFSSLIDDTEATDWGATGAQVEGRQVVVDLAGTEPVRFKAVNVSTLLAPGQNRFTALRSFELYGCTAGADSANPACDGTIAAGWSRFLTASDAFPSVNPRPVAPDMTLRTWDLADTRATHVKLVVLDNQCTGQTSYQGDQDNDPQVNSDCRATNPGTPFLPRNTEVHATELQVLSSKAQVKEKQTK
jgi:extracellular elastinolytic metalloproteinase